MPKIQRMGRKSLKDTRRKEIVKVFYKIAKKTGIENTSIAMIAKEMNINPSLIIHYFETREELTYALIDFIVDKYLLIYEQSDGAGAASRESLVAIINDLFSKKWNRLFDDGLFYSCYALTFRDKKVKQLYKRLSDTLRENLESFLRKCQATGAITIENPRITADLIYMLVDGAYYYLSLVSNKKEYNTKLDEYKKEAFKLLGLHDTSPTDF